MTFAFKTWTRLTRTINQVRESRKTPVMSIRPETGWPTGSRFSAVTIKPSQPANARRCSNRWLLAFRQQLHLGLKPVFQIPARRPSRSFPKPQSSAGDLVATEFNARLHFDVRSHVHRFFRRPTDGELDGRQHQAERGRCSSE